MEPEYSGKKTGKKQVKESLEQCWEIFMTIK